MPSIVAKASVLLVTLALAGLLVRVVEQKSATADADQARGKGGGPAPVTVAPVVERDVPVELRTFAAVEASADVDIKAQVPGPLAGVHVTEGQDVQAGDLLFTLDTRPFEVALKQAEAAAAKTTALAANARREAGRLEELHKKGIAPEDALDQARTALASVLADQRLAEAAAENARLQLGYCRIAAPIAGRTGALAAHEGDLVKANDAPLISIKRVAPVLAVFSVPQRDLPSVARAMAAGAPAVRALIPGEEERPEAGVLVFLDNAVDSATGTVRLKAAFANEGHRLWPGQHVNVVLALGVRAKALTVPSRAVQQGQKGPAAWVVRPDRTAEFRELVPAGTDGEDTVVLAGLSAGELVVTEGQMRLARGGNVLVQDGRKDAPQEGKDGKAGKAARP